MPNCGGYLFMASIEGKTVQYPPRVNTWIVITRANKLLTLHGCRITSSRCFCTGGVQTVTLMPWAWIFPKWIMIPLKFCLKHHFYHEYLIVFVHCMRLPDRRISSFFSQLHFQICHQRFVICTALIYFFNLFI